MRSTLVELGPWQWPAVFGIAAVLLLVVFAWRRLERALGEEPAPMDRSWWGITTLFVGLFAVGLLLLINRYGPVKVRSYGVMLLLGFAAGAYYAHRAGARRGLTVPLLIDFVFLVLVLAIIGARALFVLLALGEYAKDPLTVVDVWRGGLSFHGGLAGAILGAVLFVRWRKLRFAVLADLAIPGLAIGYAITRIGCFLNGCCHGHPTDLPWGVVFPENAQRFPMPVHPTQLYAGLGSLLIFLILVRLAPRLHRPGQVLPVYLVLYSILRFICEQTRRGATAEVSTLIPALTVGQIACIVTAVGGVVWFLLLQRMPYENPVTAPLMTVQEPKRASGARAAARKRS